MIELYIENNKIDITDDLEINFTYEIIDPDKLSSIKNSFTKTVNIPGTPNNNLTFGYIFRLDRINTPFVSNRIGSDYDPYLRVNWYITKNGTVINRGYCTLDKIIVKNDFECTYQLTLYGGLGEFFYNLSYNEDGSEKTLYDLYWNWLTYYNFREDSSESGEQTTQDNENEILLYDARASLVAAAYSKLNPYNHYTGITNIENDVVFIPCYSGLYEDFDSKSMLVNTGNQNVPIFGNTKVISDDYKNLLLEAFPDSFTQDNKTYNTLSRYLTAKGERYGLVKFSRDLDPFEAGEIRVNQMPIGIRFSKLMEVISNPINNGGYEVIWDESIKSSPYWLYSFIMMNRLIQNKNTNTNNVRMDLETPPMDDSETSIYFNCMTGGDPYVDGQNITQTLYDHSVDLSQGTYVFNMNYDLTLKIQAHPDILNDPNRKKFNSIFNIGGPGTPHPRITYNLFVVITRLTPSDTNDVTNVVDLFYIYNNTDPITSFYLSEGDASHFKSAVEEYLISKGITNVGEITEIIPHNLTTQDITFDNTTPVEITAIYEKINLNHYIEIHEDTSSLKIEQYQCLGWILEQWDGSTLHSSLSGIYGINIPPIDWPSDVHRFYTIFGMDWYEYSNRDKYSYTLKMNTNGNNGVYLYRSGGYVPLKIYKKDLFENSQSPMKYLSGFCKLMNYKFICDNTEKKIYIKEFKNYYTDNRYDLTDRIDLSRNIDINVVTTKYKNIDIGLETLDTYPVNILTRGHINDWAHYVYNTGVEYPLPDTKLLDNLIFQNTIDWQQNSIFYNIIPQFPKAYNLPTISWTLFNNEDRTQNVLSATQFTPGIPASSIEAFVTANDWYPKNALFNKENTIVDINASLVFLNGFVKNYDYIKVDQDWTADWIGLGPIRIEDGTIDEHGNFVTSSTQKRYTYNLSTKYSYFITINYTNSSYATDYSYAINYYDENMNFLGGEYTKAEIYAAGGFDKVELLNIPNNVYYVIISYDNSESNNMLFWKQDPFGYIIAPRLLITNDSYEQYYLNQQRCYQYDFNYSTAYFRNWGYGDMSNDNKSATSWALPMFTKDLYNIYSTGPTYDVISPDWEVDNCYFNSNGEQVHDTNYKVYVYKSHNIPGKKRKKFRFSGTYDEYTPGVAINYFTDGYPSTYISSERIISSSQYQFDDVNLHTPDTDFFRIYVNVQKSNSESFTIKILDPNINTGWQENDKYIKASWNLVGGTSQYNAKTNTNFIVDPTFKYCDLGYTPPIRYALNSVDNNEYKLINWPRIYDYSNYDSNIFFGNWSDYLLDLYGQNSKIVTAYVDLSGLGDPNDIMRNIYYWKSRLWVITKIENFKIANTTSDKFSKVTMHTLYTNIDWID